MDHHSIQYRPFKANDATAVHGLVTDVFDEFVAPLYVREGVETFLDHIHPHAILSRSGEDHFMIVAEDDSRIVGVIEIRKNSHVSLLFVGKAHQGTGIAKELLGRAVEKCRYYNSKLAAVTVNSSPNARPAYERLGFTATGEERTTDGIRYTPMAMVL